MKKISKLNRNLNKPHSSHRLRKLLKISAGVVMAVMLLLGGLFFMWNRQLNQVKITSDAFADVARLHPVKIREVRQETKEEDLVKIVKEAHKHNIKLSIAGSQHSQGGHTYYDDAIVLDMKSFNSIKKLDIKNKLLLVESGATWRQIQDYIAPPWFGDECYAIFIRVYSRWFVER